MCSEKVLRLVAFACCPPVCLNSLQCSLCLQCFTEVVCAKFTKDLLHGSKANGQVSVQLFFHRDLPSSSFAPSCHLSSDFLDSSADFPSAITT